MKRYYLYLFAFCSALSASAVAAQAQLPGGPYYVMNMLQGEAAKLPADNVAYHDGNSLKIALRQSGLDENSRREQYTTYLIGEDGTKIEGQPDGNGMINFPNVGAKEGWYSLVATGGKAAYIAMATYLKAAPKQAAPADAATPATPPPVFEMPIGTIDPRQISGIVSEAGNAPSSGSLTPLGSYSMDVPHHYRVILQPDGTLVGRVIVPEAGFERMTGPVQLIFLRNGLQMANVMSSADGRFSVRGLTPGVHTVIASGPAGHAAFAFEIVAPAEQLPPLASVDGRRVIPVSTSAAMQAPNELIIVLIPPRLMPGVREVVLNAYAPPFVDGGLAGAGFPPPLAGGGFGPGMGGGGVGGGGMGGGFGGGGGGLGGGFGGLGALLGIGGLAAGIVALASEDDGFDAVISSP